MDQTGQRPGDREIGRPGDREVSGPGDSQVGAPAGDVHPREHAPGPAPPDAPHLADRVHQLEHRITDLVSAVQETGNAVAANSAGLVPAWRRVSEGEQRLPVTTAIAVMIALQAAVPERLTLTASWVLPVVELMIAVVLIVSNPRRITHSTRWVRLLSLGLIAVASLANGWSAIALIIALVRGGAVGKDPTTLLLTGGNIWLTNILVFGLWYWDLDRGGPGARARAENNSPDFLFPEMTSPELADVDWEPYFVDYLYVAYTNATAFSPTDTLPFSRWSKLAMMIQSTISLTTGALVIARAVNILQ